MTAHLVYDVFTGRRFGGNQHAVIPDETGLAKDDLQRIAREFNFSETPSVFPPEDPGHTARVRIFTPTMEVPFAGCPAIGTTVALLYTARGAYKGTIHRGEDMGGPSRIGVDAVPDRVTVSGQAVRVMAGQLP